MCGDPEFPIEGRARLMIRTNGTGRVVLTTYWNAVMDFGHSRDLWRSSNISIFSHFKIPAQTTSC